MERVQGWWKEYFLFTEQEKEIEGKGKEKGYF